MRTILLLLVVVVLIGIAGIMTGYINVNQTRTASLPKIRLEGGQAPAFDVQTANVSVSNEAHTVKTPVIDVKKP